MVTCPDKPLPHRDECELLLAFIDQQRDGIRYAAYGLNDEQARLTPTAGTLSIGGLVTHVTAMERGWIDLIPGARPGDVAVQDQADAEAGYEDGFRLAPDRTLADALGAMDEVAAETAEVVRRISLDEEVPVPKGVPWYPDDIESWTVRWVSVCCSTSSRRSDATPDTPTSFANRSIERRCTS